MERTTFNLLFYIRRTKLNKAGEAPVFMRITVNGERADASANRFIAPRLWNTAKGKAVESGRGCKELNFYLDAVSARILRIHREMVLESECQPVSARTVLNRYLGKDRPERHTLMEVFREHNERCQKLSGIDFAPGTVERYETCLRLTAEFMRRTYRKEDIYLDELSCQFIEDYEFYLKTERKCAHNTTTKYLKNFKKITRIALEKGFMKNDPFRKTRFHLEPVERDFLEYKELKMLLDKPILIPRMAQVRDIFCFCCLTGLAFSDVLQLGEEHIVTDLNDKRWIRKARQKTGNMCNIPLMDTAEQILSRYRGNTYCQAKGVLLPVCSNQKMNDYLKELAELAEINEPIRETFYKGNERIDVVTPKYALLGTHAGRRTFICNALAMGIPAQVVMKWTGHSDYKAMKPYIDIADETKANAMSKFNQL